MMIDFVGSCDSVSAEKSNDDLGFHTVEGARRIFINFHVYVDGFV